MKAQGQSMVPFIHENSELLVQKDKSHHFQIGDTVCFLQKNGLVLHRIIKNSFWNKSHTYLLKGDNNTDSDGYYQAKDILGKVTHIIHEGLIINTSESPILNRLLARSSLYYLKAKFESIQSLTNRFIFLLLRIVNKNTGLKEIQNIIFGLQNNEKLHVSSQLEKTLALKNKFTDIFLKNKNEIVYQEFFLQLLNSERKKIFQVLNKLKIRFVSLDNPTNNDIKSGSDIDIAVDYNQLIQVSKILKNIGYKVKNRPPQEITFINTKNNIQLDVHFIINLPRKSYFNKKKSLKFTNEYLNRLLNTHSSQKTKNTYFLFAKIISYWTNDFLKGLQPLHELSKTINNFPISYSSLKRIAQKYDFYQETLLVFCIYKHIFNSSTFDTSTNDANLRTRLLSHYFTLKKVSIFGSIEHNWDEANKQTQKQHIECFLASLIVNEKTQFARLLRPKTIILLIKSFFNMISKQKSNLIKNLFKQ